MNHFIELKYRIFYLSISYLLITIICYIFAEELIYLIAKPLTTSSADVINTKRLIYTNITEAFITQLKLSFYVATYLMLPVIMYSLWSFVKPGLYHNEKEFIKNTFVPSMILFIVSIFLSYKLLIPTIYKFFIGFETNFESSMISIELEAKISEYVSTILQTVFIMSLLSQYPIIVLVLMYLNIIDYKWLIGRRKLFIFSFFCLGALVTPPDVLSQIILATILLVSYEAMLYVVILHKNYVN
jgi:sec-independent protein translocase protein TatC